MRASILVLLAVACAGDGADKPRPEICRNNVDDDEDGQLDCTDSDCAFVCGEICDDGLDNDQDGQTDCADQGCLGQCPETCDDGLDNDLDGLTDCQDGGDCGAVCPETCDDTFDNDGDTLVDCADPDCGTTCDGDADSYVGVALGGDDCDDADPQVHPGAPEVCNAGVDDDCDALADGADDNLVDGVILYEDLDADGWGNLLADSLGCEPGDGLAEQPGDCDDTDAGANPDQVEICDGGDEDCDTLVDEGDPSLDPTTLKSWYPDADGDGFGAPEAPVVQCLAPPDTADNDLDCDDLDTDVGEAQAWTRDDDRDGFGAGTPTDPQCDPPGNDWVPSSLGEDCNDANIAISPAAIDVCGDGVDQDCDGVDFLGCFDTEAGLSFYGEATVDEVAGTYTGSESYQYVGSPSGWLICEWTWTMLDWDHDPTAVGANPLAVPCTDVDGFACDWSFAVHQSAGVMTDGTTADCAFYGLTPTTPTYWWGYGWTEAYNAGGTNYGATMMYFVAPSNVWVGLNPAAQFAHDETYDQVTGAFDYEWVDYAILPPP